ncbi:phenylpyruvate tautomerase PptA (4-oxalocrotonate tautomerase family) [Glaciimonas immobilis]|uniref:Phenylpyruvate tautomerase PptA (4-oxalocrotonate tautomerase family) n=1 Tax=Glaciimonas immobilis TaxID=728004 RepID=A0A840RUN0_9BURK|nr:phenylpyruvate tautomerase PptA (4-oxalocrotonate tautomerase family) [Glaciimonas immobilis]
MPYVNINTHEGVSAEQTSALLGGTRQREGK